MDALNQLRREKDEFFKEHPQSPLTGQQKKVFSGLRYYEENSRLRFETEIIPFEQLEQVEMQTSTGDIQIYTRLGKIRFQVEDQAAELTIFSSEHGYFLPFVDAMAGSETYPAGRYLDPEPLPGQKVLVDFNLAYNPYCAYNDQWSCPLTPFENRLKVPVRAGEKLPEGL